MNWWARRFILRLRDTSEDVYKRQDLLLNRERNPYEETKGVFGSLVSIPIPAYPSQ